MIQRDVRKAKTVRVLGSFWVPGGYQAREAPDLYLPMLLDVVDQQQLHSC